MPKSLPSLKHFMVGLQVPGLPDLIQEPIWASHERAAKDAALEKHPGGLIKYVLKYFRVDLVEEDADESIFFDCQADDAEHAKEQAEDAYPNCRILGLVDEALFVIWAPSEESEVDQCADGFFNDKDGWGHFETATLYSGFERDDGLLLMSSGNDHQFVAYEVAERMVKAHTERDTPVTRVRVVLDIAYQPEGMTPEALQDVLTRGINHAIGNGMLTGGTPALVDEWTMKVSHVADEAVSLEQKQDDIDVHKTPISELRNLGYAVTVFTPEELKGAPADMVEDRLVELGWDVIDALRTEPFDDELDEDDVSTSDDSAT